MHMHEYVTRTKWQREKTDLLAELAADDAHKVARSTVETVQVVDTELSVRLRRRRYQPQQQASFRYRLNAVTQ